MRKNIGNGSSGTTILAEKVGDLQGYIDRMKDARVLVVGDVMLDHFIYGDVSRMSAEAPVPVLLKGSEVYVPGGAGNVLANLSGLKVRAHIVAVTGDDPQAALLQSCLESYGAGTEGLVRDDARPTIVKTRFLTGSKHLLRVDAEDTAPVSGAIADRLYKQAEALIDSVSVLILSDYGKGTLTPALIARLIALAREKGIPVLVDPKGDDYSKYKGATVVTPNGKELSLATGGMKTGTDSEVVAAAQSLQKSSGIISVLATRSQDGMTLLEKDLSPVHIRATAQEVFDVTGAGDTVIATLAAALSAGASLPAAAQIANLAAGLVVAKVGTAVVACDDLYQTVRNIAAA